MLSDKVENCVELLGCGVADFVGWVWTISKVSAQGREEIRQAHLRRMMSLTFVQHYPEPFYTVQDAYVLVWLVR